MPDKIIVLNLKNTEDKPDKITTLKTADNTKVYPNTKDQNIPDTIARVKELNPIKEDINNLKTQVSSIDTKIQNITGISNGTSMVGTLDVEKKATFGSDVEVVGTVKVNKFSNIVDKDYNSIANNFFSLDKNEQTFEIGKDSVGKIIKTHSVSSDGKTNYYGKYVFQADSITLSSGDGRAYLYISPSAINHKFPNSSGYQYVFPDNKGGILALTSDIPTYYSHTITITGGDPSDMSIVSFTGISKTDTSVNSLQTLSNVLGGKWFAVSGIFPDETHVGLKRIPISIWVDKNYINDTHLVLASKTGTGTFNLSGLINLSIEDNVVKI